MEYSFFYFSVIIVIALTFFLRVFKESTFPRIIIGITTIGYSLINDTIFGLFYKLFYYISPQESALYSVLAAVLIYPFLNIIYVSFMPQNRANVAIYTAIWIGAMLVFEYFSLVTKTIVFTGWQPFPWSIITYIIAYNWIYFFYKYLLKRSLQIF